MAASENKRLPPSLFFCFSSSFFFSTNKIKIKIFHRFSLDSIRFRNLPVEQLPRSFTQFFVLFTEFSSDFYSVDRPFTQFLPSFPALAIDCYRVSLSNIGLLDRLPSFLPSFPALAFDCYRVSLSNIGLLDLLPSFYRVFPALAIDCYRVSLSNVGLLDRLPSFYRVFPHQHSIVTEFL